ncbi:MAG: ABC transporter permease [Spirochaetaceae bacterium]
MKLCTVAARNILRNMRRSVLSGLAIAVAAMAITLLFSLLAGMKADLAYNLQTYVSGEIRVRNPRFTEHETVHPLHFSLDAPRELVDTAASAEGVSAVAPRIRFPGSVFVNDETHNAVGIGLDFARERDFQGIDERLTSGRIPSPGERAAVLGVGLADELALGLGDTFTVLTQTATRGSNAMTFEVAGLARFPVSAFTETHFLVPLDTARYFLRMPDQLTDLLVKTTGEREAAETASMLESTLRGFSETPLVAEAWTRLPTSYTFMEIADLAYAIMALFFFVLGSSVIVNTTMMVIYERTREIGTLSAMGMEGGQLIRMFFLEAVMIAAAGAAAGVVLGIAVTAPFSVFGLDMGASFEGMDFEVSNVLYPKINLRSTVFVFVYSVSVAAAASLLPSWRAARISPAEALRSL